MTIQELNSSLTKELKAYIKLKGYVDSGDLLKSIKFKCTFVDNDLNVKFMAMDYIQYINKGNLLKEFLETKRPIELIQEFYTSNIVII